MRRLALVGMLLGMPVLSHAQTNQNSWDGLSTSHAGQRIEVVETNLKKHKGEFSILTDEAIQLRERGTDVGIKKQDVMRVTLLDESHRVRNALILGSVGAGAGAGISAAATRCSTSSGSFNLCGVGNGAIVAASALIGLVGGAGAGAAIPSHPTVYRVEHH
jgi:hypothetical protein